VVSNLRGPRRTDLVEHIEVISRHARGARRCGGVRIEDVGDTEFLIDELTDKFRFTAARDAAENERVVQAGGRPATPQTLLLGIDCRSDRRQLSLSRR
jgi:hypothetical protein